ncbi:xanthine dehydrogenase family protein molybdopterin-binding subunit [Rhodobacter sp. ETT8]|uniref:Xanthine dehydrogenase family protein molybdopterin-binding subunit n=1 Tax=Pseudotabrizicola algicola TaxID=2709381 RepID=A0A6B3RHA9_9RHOB|nr:xanthine dehydrogenase family protein molybdopterin-binding subunit [Pseudotabrizicola algicola]NEX45424.1 xanthine dehydrogenase family protein molybdopterin-binding subunit [Pseudotabrizicola algicola]
MDEPDHRNRLDAMVQGVLGTGMDRPDGPEKVTGSATYAHDGQVAGMLHGVMVRATIAKGRLEHIDAQAVEALPGVRAVLHGDRFLRNPAQGTANEAPVQGSRDIAYLGQPVALVVADRFEQARHGAQSVTLRYSEESASVAPDAETAEVPDKKQSSAGDLAAAMDRAAFCVDAVYTTPGHNSAAMEPHAAIAAWEGDLLTVRASCQMLKYNVNELADALGVDPEHVRILSPFVGGGFGSKLGISPETVAAALAARALGQPVAVALSRQQVFEATMRRSETRQHIRLAADAEGRLTGIGHEALVSNLEGEDFSEPVTQATPFLYRGENRLIGHRISRVNRTCAGSVRAPGEAVGVTALEIAMDELATAAGIDPVDLRRRNIPERDPGEDRPFSSHMLRAALDDGAAAFGWENRPQGGARQGDWLAGCGMSSASRVNMIGKSSARVTLHPDGTALVETDMTDIGTGTYAILNQIAAEMLGLPPARVKVRLGDSDLPKSAGSGGSWGASSAGSSVFLACERIRQDIAERCGCDEGTLTLKDGMAIADNRARPLAQVLAGAPLQAEGEIDKGKTSEAVRQATFGAFFAEVAVNAVTGETRLRRMHGSFAAGRILNAKTARSQCLGGMTFGIGMALTEELIHDPRDGHIVNHDLAEYHLPVNADVPQLSVNLLEERDPWANPMQAKGIGELGICGAGACIVNAIHDATGIRVRHLPATLDKLLEGLDRLDDLG